MRSAQRQWPHILLAALALPAALIAGAWVFERTESDVAVIALWVGIALGFSFLWGLRLALLFVVPFTCGILGGVIAGGYAADPAFFGSATQVGPVLLLVLGLEQRSLRDEVNSPLEMFLFVLLFGYVALAILTALYGSAVCHGQAGCDHILVEFRVVGIVGYSITVVSLTAGGLVAGLSGALSLSFLSARKYVSDPGTPQVDTPPAATTEPPRLAAPALALAAGLLCLLFRRGSPRGDRLGRRT
jgi:hypothetical protein